MARYAVGDIQGCFKTFEALLSQIKFNPKQDQLWLCGDLVARGPDSLAVLKWCYQHRDSVKMVLGNHDLHLLCHSLGIKKKKDFKRLMKDPEMPVIIEWLRQQPFLYAEDEFVMVHAGVYPEWTIEEAKSYAKEASELLKSDEWEKLLFCWKELFVDTWDGKKEFSRINFIMNSFTHMRQLTEDMRLDMESKGSPDQAPSELKPWHEFESRKTQKETILCGHWAMQGFQKTEKMIALDSGCVYGAPLTCVRLEDLEVFEQASLDC